MNESIHRWYAYQVWANERVVAHLKSLPSELFRKEVNLGFKSIAEVIGHMVAADEVWLARIKEESPPPLFPRPFSTIEEAGDAMADVQAKIREFLRSVPDTEKSVTYRNTSGQEFRNSISEIILHVVNHGTYHRGNITTMLRSLGHEGVLTDYIAFLRI